MDSKILNSIKDRMPWTIASRAFRAAGIPTGQGWFKTVSRLEALDDKRIEGKLSELLLEHTICGEKFTKFYKIPTDDRKRLQDYISQVSIEETALSKAFPKIVAPESFIGIDMPQVLVGKYQSDDGIALIYTCEMKVTSREVIDEADIFSDPEKIKRDYDEIVGLKFRSVQLFNVVWVSHNDDVIEVRVDCPRGIQSDSLHQIHSIIKSMIGDALGGKDIGFPLDLFPLIESIYQDGKEGKVVELGFTTSTGSVKLEKMRRTRTCLRDELYHIGGKKELRTKISPFRISVLWEFGTEDMLYQPELTLAGTSRGKHHVDQLASAAVVSGAAVGNCIGAVDYEHVRARLISHFVRLSSEGSQGDSVAAE